MAALTVRNIPDATHRALKARAAEHGRSTEAEVREILEAAVRPLVPLGSFLASIGNEIGGVDFVPARDKSPVEPASFE